MNCQSRQSKVRRVHDTQEATRAMLALADQLSRGRPAALAIAQHAWKADIDPLPLLRAAQAMALTFGPDEFRALLEEGSLPEEQVLSVLHLLLTLEMWSRMALVH